MSSGSYEKVRGGKLMFKGGLAPAKKISKKSSKRKQKEVHDAAGDVEENAGAGAPEVVDFVDTGTGHAPDGKKSKKYEDLFPVETKRFGYVLPENLTSRESALDERVKKKADRYCK